MDKQWTTIIEQRDGEGWVFFSQQSIKPGEESCSDAEYLEKCRALPDAGELRIAPSETARFADPAYQRQERRVSRVERSIRVKPSDDSLGGDETEPTKAR